MSSVYSLFHSKFMIDLATLAVISLAALALWFFFLKRKHSGRHRRKTVTEVITCISSIVLWGIIALTITQIIYLLLHHFTELYTGWISTTNVILLSAITIKYVFALISQIEASLIAKGNDITTSKAISRLLKSVTVLILILMAGQHFGLSVSGLMTFGGVGGIAIGLAGKDIISNFFSGIMLYFDRPFNVGDWIRSPDRNIEGTVAEIGWRLTKINTFDHRPLYVPNSVFSSISVENPGRMTNRRIKTEIGLRYEDAKLVRVIVDDIRTMLQNNPDIDTTQTLLVYMNEFADSSINIMVYCFTKTTVWAEWLKVQQDVYLDIIDIVHARGADMAFPSQTLYLEKE
ncbi:MAG: mechanosensitive ion channel family protein [Plesiomonas shigelloides]